MSVSSFLPYGKQSIEADDLDAVKEALNDDYLTTGPRIDEFEKNFSRIVGVSETVVCGNGTQALHLACLAAGIEEGSCAIVPSVTFLATANAVRYCGAEVVFADVDPDTGLMTSESFESALARADEEGLKVSAVLPVHLAGQTVDQARIQQIAVQNNIVIISDACHALGTTYRGAEAGSGAFEDFAVFSFHPVKTIAMGEGGAVTTNNPQQAESMRRLRSHGMSHRPANPADPAAGLDANGNANPWYYEMEELGYNYRVTDIQCALGLSQLKKLDRFIQRRKELAATYDQLLKPLAPIIRSPKRMPNCDPAWHLYAVRIDFDALDISRAALMECLRERGIGTQVHYIPVHTQPYYRNRYGDLTLPGADKYYARTLSLPLYPGLTGDDIKRVVDELEQIIKEGKS